MFSFRKSKSKKNPLLPQKRDTKRYEEEKKQTQSEKVSDRLKLAKSEDTHKEILYYLAENDENESVRKAVAENLMTPIQASAKIAKDKSVDVRLALVKRLCHLLPDLSADEYSQLYAHSVQALSDLALDEVLKIRKSLSSALKDKAYAPPKVVAQLARDVEKEVSEPILKFCVAVPDQDLIEILKSTGKEWVARAIAQREALTEQVSKAVVDRSDDFPKAGQDLLQNKTAKIDSDTLNYIIEKAKDLPAWHEPLALRNGLPPDMLKRIAGFVSKKIAKKMMKNNDFDPVTKDEITDTAKRRLNFLNDDKGRPISPDQKLKHLIADHKLNEESVGDALALREIELVIKALAYLSEKKAVTIQQLLATKAPKSIVALSWKAGFSMRFAVTLQKDLAKIPHEELIYPKSGDKYPLDEETMQFQLDFFDD